MAQTSNNLADVLRSTRLAAELSDAQIDTLAGVMLLRDGGCASPDLSDKSWKVTPGWKVEKGERTTLIGTDGL